MEKLVARASCTQYTTQINNRPLDKRECLMTIKDNFCSFCIKTYVVTPHLNCLIEMVQLRGHNIRFQSETRLVRVEDTLPDSTLPIT